MNSAHDVLRNYLLNEFTKLSNNPYYFEWIDSHVERFTSSTTDYIIEQIVILYKVTRLLNRFKSSLNKSNFTPSNSSNSE